MTQSVSPFIRPDVDYPQSYTLVSALGYIWDVPTLEWVKDTGGVVVVGGVTIADGADVAEGATTDAAVVTDTTGTVSGKLRGLVKWAFERMPASLGQKAMTASFPVVIASDQSFVSVTATPVASATATQSSVADSATSVTILAANSARLGSSVANDSTVTLYLRLSATAATTTAYTVALVANAYYEVPFRYTGAITGIWASDPGTGAARVTEFS